MTRWEARAVLGFAVLLVCGGLIWLFGALGMLGAGAALAVLVLFVIDVRERAGGEAVEEPVWPRGDHPIRR